jgi:hypothetical protein
MAEFTTLQEMLLIAHDKLERVWISSAARSRDDAASQPAWPDRPPSVRAC